MAQQDPVTYLKRAGRSEAHGAVEVEEIRKPKRGDPEWVAGNVVGERVWLSDHDSEPSFVEVYPTKGGWRCKAWLFVEDKRPLKPTTYLLPRDKAKFYAAVRKTMNLTE